MKLPRGRFKVILADPPWPFKTRGNGDLVPTQGEQPYATMTMADLHLLPVEKIADDDCVLIMWTTSSHLEHACELAKSWGFKYKSLGFVWEKTCKGDPTKFKIGMGFWIRQEAEIALVFTRGKPKRMSAAVRQIIQAPAREHSRKPDEQYERIEALAAGPYLELFARKSRKGWKTWGDQATKFDDAAVYEPTKKLAPLKRAIEAQAREIGRPYNEAARNRKAAQPVPAPKAKGIKTGSERGRGTGVKKTPGGGRKAAAGKRRSLSEILG